MKKNFRKTLLLVTVFIVILASFSITFALEKPIEQNGEPITPCWVGLCTISHNFIISSDGIANPIIRGTTYPGAVDYVNVKVYLKRSNGSGWTTIKTWDKNISISLDRFTFNETYAVSKNYTYKYTATVKSYKNNALLDTVTFDSQLINY